MLNIILLLPHCCLPTPVALLLVMHLDHFCPSARHLSCFLVLSYFSCSLVLSDLSCDTHNSSLSPCLTLSVCHNHIFVLSLSVLGPAYFLLSWPVCSCLSYMFLLLSHLRTLVKLPSFFFSITTFST